MPEKQISQADARSIKGRFLALQSDWKNLDQEQKGIKLKEILDQLDIPTEKRADYNTSMDIISDKLHKILKGFV